MKAKKKLAEKIAKKELKITARIKKPNLGNAGDMLNKEMADFRDNWENKTKEQREQEEKNMAIMAKFNEPIYKKQRIENVKSINELMGQSRFLISEIIKAGIETNNLAKLSMAINVYISRLPVDKRPKRREDYEISEISGIINETLEKESIMLSEARRKQDGVQNLTLPLMQLVQEFNQINMNLEREIGMFENKKMWKILKKYGITKKNLTVGGSLDLRDTAITTLPDNLTVGGWLDLRGTPITTLPDNLTVGSWLDLRDTAITTLPDNLTVGSLYLQDMQNINYSNIKN